MKSLYHRIAACLLLAIVVAAMYYGMYLKSVSDYQRTVRDMQIAEVDTSQLTDGTYIGDCNVNFIYAKVAVQIQNGEITQIQILEHRNERGKQAESVLDEIVKEQKINVDAVSGATNSSTVLKKAVETALSK